MRVFITGGSGFIGSAIVAELLRAGHEVTGLARSEASAQRLRDAGARVHRGDVNDPESVRRGAAAHEGAVHLAFFHAFGQASPATRLRVIAGGAPSGIVERFMRAATDVDRRTIDILASTVSGSDRAVVAAFGTLGMRAGTLAFEDAEPDPQGIGALRSRSEATLLAHAAGGVRASVVRLPPIVHGKGDRAGFAPRLFEAANKHRVAAYVGDGGNRWPAVHRDDAARLVRSALERGGIGGARYHAVAEEGVPFIEIARAIGKRTNVPIASRSLAEAKKIFGFLSLFIPIDNPTSSEATRAHLAWTPSGPTVLEDLSGDAYAASARG